MGTGKDIEDRGHVVGFKEEINKALLESADSFFSWFSNDQDEKSSFVYGNWDFSCHIASKLAPYIEQPWKKNALEIGCGGGRLLAPAAGYFRHVSGIDIHNNLPFVEKYFHNKCINNISLKQSDGVYIPYEDESFDVVYSFIVFQHMEKIKILEKYIQETLRVLSKGGIAVLYFGRFSRFSKNKNRSNILAHFMDRLGEYIYLPKGYQELPAQVNVTNLLVSRKHVEKLTADYGGKCLKWHISHRRVPDGFDKFGGQHGIIIQK